MSDSNLSSVTKTKLKQRWLRLIHPDDWLSGWERVQLFVVGSQSGKGQNCFLWIPIVSLSMEEERQIQFQDRDWGQRFHQLIQTQKTPLVSLKGTGADKRKSLECHRREWKHWRPSPPRARASTSGDPQGATLLERGSVPRHPPAGSFHTATIHLQAFPRAGGNRGGRCQSPARRHLRTFAHRKVTKAPRICLRESRNRELFLLVLVDDQGNLSERKTSVVIFLSSLACPLHEEKRDSSLEQIRSAFSHSDDLRRLATFSCKKIFPNQGFGLSDPHLPPQAGGLLKSALQEPVLPLPPTSQWDPPTTRRASTSRGARAAPAGKLVQNQHLGN